MFGLGWGLMTRVLSGACLHPFLSWGVDAASASRRPGSGSSFGGGMGPSHRRESEARRRQAPAGRRPGEGPWAGGCLQHRRCLGGLRHAWTGEWPPLPGPQSLAWAQESRVISGPSSFLSRVQGCCVPRPHLERVTQGVSSRGPGCSRLPGERKLPSQHQPRPRAPSGRTRPAWGQHGLAQRGGTGRTVPPPIGVGLLVSWVGLGNPSWPAWSSCFRKLHLEIRC